MFGTLFVTKVLLTVAAILGLAMIAERATPQIAGILSGYPLGTALVLFFYGIEIDADFASASVPYNLLGHLSALTFSYVYFLSCRTAAVRSVLAASLKALTGYAMVALLMSRASVTIVTSAILSAASIALFSYLFRKTPNHVMMNKIPLTPGAMLFRIAISAGIVLLITGVAQSVGIGLAGIFSAFPLVVYPLVLMIHLTYGADSARTVLKNFPRGLWTVLLYSVTVYFAYPVLGVYLGTVIAYLVATAALLAINWRVFLAGTRMRSPQAEVS